MAPRWASWSTCSSAGCSIRVIDQITVDGPTVLLKPEAAQALGFALHELAVNAKKFGALSVPAGRVTISWRRVPQPEGDSVDLRWEERNGPAVSAPSHRRFGSMIIERHLAHAIDGDGAVVVSPGGGGLRRSTFRRPNSWASRSARRGRPPLPRLTPGALNRRPSGPSARKVEFHRE